MIDWIQANLVFIGNVAIVNAVVVISLALAIIVELAPLRRRRGQPLAEIGYERSVSNLWRFGFLFVAIQLGLALLYISTASELRLSRYMLVVYAPTFLVAYSVFLFFSRPFYDRVKEVIKETGGDVLVDLNHKILRTMLNWQLEIASAAALMLASAIYFDWQSVPFMLPPMLLMMYASIWHRKYFLRSGFGYWHKSLLGLNLIVQASKAITFVTESLEIDAALLGTADFVLLGVTGMLTAAQLLLSYLRAPSAWRSVQESVGPPPDESPSPAC